MGMLSSERTSTNAANESRGSFGHHLVMAMASENIDSCMWQQIFLLPNITISIQFSDKFVSNFHSKLFYVDCKIR